MASSSTVFTYFSDCSSKMACVNITSIRQPVATVIINIFNKVKTYLISLDWIFSFLAFKLHKLHNEALPVFFGHCQLAQDSGKRHAFVFNAGIGYKNHRYQLLVNVTISVLKHLSNITLLSARSQLTSSWFRLSDDQRATVECVASRSVMNSNKTQEYPQEIPKILRFKNQMFSTESSKTDRNWAAPT